MKTMKKLLLIFSALTFNFYAFADNHESNTAGMISDKGFLTLEGGFEGMLNVVDVPLNWGPFFLGYGQKIMLNENYIGMFEVGVGLEPVYYSSPKMEFRYGYEFMKEKKISIGLNFTTSLFYSEDINKAHNAFAKNANQKRTSLIHSLGVRGKIGVFSKMHITDSFSGLIHLGIVAFRVEGDGRGFQPDIAHIFIVPPVPHLYAHLGLRYYL